MNQPTGVFFLAYLLSWCAYVPLVVQGQGLLSGIPNLLHLAAFIVTAWKHGSAGVRELLNRMTRWRISWGWLLLAAFNLVAVFGVVVLVMRLVTGTWQAASGFGQVVELPELDWLAGWLAWILISGLGEETGWRGFAQPRMQARYSACGASLILGLLWAGWHTPVFFYNYELPLFSVMAFVVGIGAGAPLLMLVYVSAFCLLGLSPVWGKRLQDLAPVGQTALTNYLTQSIVCTTIFYGYGLGLFGQMGAATGIGLTIIIYLLQIPISHWWMKRFKHGPAEWLWPSLTYLKPQPIKRQSAG